MLGAHLQQQRGVAGVRFALWAPNARRVSVVGDFNSWDGRRHPMRLRHAAGIWEIFIPHVAIGERYKFELLDRQGELLPLKADPYALAAELRPDTASRVAALPAPQALPPQRGPANARGAPISIYEVHAPSWRHAADGNFPSWDELAATLPAYAADLGFTHVELMPISEHPFDGSWGYQTLGLYAPSARFGSPEGFARFVQACHAAGLGMLLDWVPAHFPVRRAWPRAVRRHRPVRIRRSARRLPSRLEHADLQLRPQRSAQLPGRQCACTGSSAMASTACGSMPWPR